MISSCTNLESEHDSRTENLIPADQDFDVEDLFYHYVDTVIRYPNEVIIKSTKLDTIIREEGIFTFLKYDFVLNTPDELVECLRRAINFEKASNKRSSKLEYLKIIDIYDRLSKEKYLGDTNGYLEYKINTSIICSNAYEKLGELDKSIAVLEPYMANSEVYGSKILERFIKLCIKKYGIEQVKQELDGCGRTVKYLERPSSYDNWIVEVFGAEIGIHHGIGKDSISTKEASRIVKRMPIYSLIN